MDGGEAVARELQPVDVAAAVGVRRAAAEQQLFDVLPPDAQKIVREMLLEHVEEPVVLFVGLDLLLRAEHDGDQVFRFDRLEQVFKDVVADRRARVLEIGVAGDENHEDLRVICVDVRGELQPRFARHADVRDDDFGLLAFDDADRVEGVFGGEIGVNQKAGGL